MDQKLRLQADLKDNASPKIRQLGKELKEIRRTPGMEQAQKWMAGFEESAGAFTKASEGVAGVMGGLGVSGLAAAAGLSGLVEQFKALGDHTFAMKRLGQETHMTLNQIARWEYVGQIFRMPVEQIDATLQHYGDAMVDFMRRRGEIFGQLNQQDPAEAGRLLGIADPNARFQEIIRWLGTIKDTAVRDRWATAFFGTADIDAVLTNGMPAFNKAVTDAARNAHTLTAEQQKQADDLQASIVGFENAWNDLKLSAGSTVFSELKLAADDFRKVFQDLKPYLDWMAGERGKGAGQIAADVAGAAKDAAVAKGAEIRDRWKQRIDDAAAGIAQSRGEDGNALHRNDEAPINAPTSSSGSDHPSWWKKLWKQSAYVTDEDGADQSFGGAGSTSGAEALSDGVKDGVLAAFREWKAEQEATSSGAGGGGGVQNASYETGGGRGSGGGAGVKPYSGPGDSASVQEHTGFIKQAAAALGIDPNYAVRVANSEGLHKFVGDRGTSFGDFQLHIKNNIPGLSLGGLGDDYRRETGHDPSDPRNWREMDVFALKKARQMGWGPWHGAAHVGIFGHAGMGLSPAGSLPDTTPRKDTALGNLADEARKADASRKPEAGRSQVDIHLHDRGGNIRSTGVKSNGAMQVNLRRGPTMTQPDITA